jgi:ABC-type uncharacterized transport system auxiliary subunit
MNISRAPLVFCLLFAGFCLNACSSLTRSDKPAVTTWWLKPYTGAVQVVAPDTILPLTLSVMVVPGLDSDQILTLSDDAELKPYSGARWVDNLPELVTSLVDRSLQASGRYQVVSPRAGGGPGKCKLQLELREFFAELGPSGQTSGVRVAIDGRFQCGSDAPVLLKLNASASVDDERMKVIVAAFQQAMDSVMRELLERIMGLRA